MNSMPILPNSIPEHQPSKLRVAGSSPAAPTSSKATVCLPGTTDTQPFQGFGSLNLGLSSETDPVATTVLLTHRRVALINVGDLPLVADLAFDADAHVYTVAGIVRPSVTQILEDTGVIDYSFIPDVSRDRYLQRGRAVHLATHYFDEGDLDEETLPEEIRPYLEAWKSFRHDSRFTWDRVEFRSFHPRYGYAGQLDRAGRPPAKRALKVLLDIKTTQAPEWVRMQTAAYAAFFESPRSYLRMAVELHADETYVLHEYSGQSWQADFNDFLSCLNVYRLKRRKN